MNPVILQVTQTTGMAALVIDLKTKRKYPASDRALDEVMKKAIEVNVRLQLSGIPNLKSVEAPKADRRFIEDMKTSVFNGKTVVVTFDPTNDRYTKKGSDIKSAKASGVRINFNSSDFAETQGTDIPYSTRISDDAFKKKEWTISDVQLNSEHRGTKCRKAGILKDVVVHELDDFADARSWAGKPNPEELNIFIEEVDPLTHASGRFFEKFSAPNIIKVTGMCSVSIEGIGNREDWKRFQFSGVMETSKDFRYGYNGLFPTEGTVGATMNRTMNRIGGPGAGVKFNFKRADIQGIRGDDLPKMPRSINDSIFENAKFTIDDVGMESAYDGAKVRKAGILTSFEIDGLAKFINEAIKDFGEKWEEDDGSGIVPVIEDVTLGIIEVYDMVYGPGYSRWVAPKDLDVKGHCEVQFSFKGTNEAPYERFDFTALIETTPTLREMYENLDEVDEDGFSLNASSTRVSVQHIATRVAAQVIAAETFKCPECGTKVLKTTGYCVKCQKKVKSAAKRTAMDEQEASEILEDLVGGPKKAFYLLKLWTRAQQASSGNRYSLGQGVDPLKFFVKAARRDNYSYRAIEHFLENIQGQRLPTSWKR